MPGVSRLLVSMEDEPYTRSELYVAAGEFPQRGPLCPHCERRIPRFADLAEQDEHRVRELIRSERPLMGFPSCALRRAALCCGRDCGLSTRAGPSASTASPLPAHTARCHCGRSLPNSAASAGGIGTTRRMW